MRQGCFQDEVNSLHSSGPRILYVPGMLTDQDWQARVRIDILDLSRKRIWTWITDITRRTKI